MLRQKKLLDQYNPFDLFHISKEAHLEGMWYPRIPSKYLDSETKEEKRIDENGEQELASICYSKNILGAYRSLNNMGRRDEDNIFYVYIPMVTGDEYFLDTEDLLLKEITPDAHMTDEVRILSPVLMVLALKIKITVLDNTPEEYTPYSKNFKTLIREISPKEIRVSVLKEYLGDKEASILKNKVSGTMSLEKKSTKSSFVSVEDRFNPGWYVVPGIPYFLAREDGSVLSTHTRKSTFGSLNTNGYLRVTAFSKKDKVKKDYKVHVLICLAFKGPKPSDNHEVGHNDDVRTNNRASNLDWVTRQDNMERVHKRRKGIMLDNIF